MKLFTARNVMIVALIWIVAALTIYGTSGLKESFWSNPSPSPYLAEPVGQSKSALSALLINDSPTSIEACQKGSSYSSSGGCIILTDAQKHMINTRGGNRTCESCNNSF